MGSSERRDGYFGHSFVYTRIMVLAQLQTSVVLDFLLDIYLLPSGFRDCIIAFGLFITTPFASKHELN